MTKRPNPLVTPKPSKAANARELIANSRVVQNLIDHQDGVRDMTPSQVQAALGLLKKFVPDVAMAKVEHEHSGEVRIQVINTGVPRRPGQTIGATYTRSIESKSTELIENLQDEEDAINELLKDIDKE